MISNPEDQERHVVEKLVGRKHTVWSEIDARGKSLQPSARELKPRVA
jgi:hypothetical protein